MSVFRLLVLSGIFAASAATAATAQDQASTAAPGAIGAIDFGGRFLSVDGDPARLQRYRDLRDGAFLDGFRYRREREGWLFEANAENIGYRDQRYQAAFNAYGKLRTWFEWTQVPLFYSVDTRTAYSRPAGADGVLLLDDPLQGSLPPLAAAASEFDLLQRRRATARFGILATPVPALDLSVSVSSSRRAGEMPWSTSFGFGNVVEVPGPLDQRTTDLNAAIEWGGARGSLRVQYDGSWFDNRVETLVWDNPLRVTDSPTAGSGRGRLALSPDSTSTNIGITGSIALPARSRATAYASLGAWNQNQQLLPFTINSQLPEIPLARQTAEAEAQITALNLNFSSRPTARLWFNARYRRYDFDNQTPEFATPQTVAYDQTVQNSPLAGTHAFGYVRDWFDADASFDVVPFAALRIGYGLEDVERTFRFLEATTEHTLRISIDTTRSQYVTLRGVYERSKRIGEGLDEEALDDVGEQVSLRQFDISDRNRDRFSAIVHVMPHAAVGLNATVGLGKDRRPDASFGLQEQQTRFYSAGLDFVPNEVISAGLIWGFDRYTSLQQSRQANPGPQFNDPTRDWQTDAADRVHYVNAVVDLVKAIPRTDVRVGYDFNRSRARYLYVLPANSTLPTPQQLPEVLNELHRASADVTYFFARHFAAGVLYTFDRYQVDDFALSPSTLTRLDMPNTLLLGHVWRPYTANTVWARLSYFW